MGAQRRGDLHEGLLVTSFMRAQTPKHELQWYHVWWCYSCLEMESSRHQILIAANASLAAAAAQAAPALQNCIHFVLRRLDAVTACGREWWCTRAHMYRRWVVLATMTNDGSRLPCDDES